MGGDSLSFVPSDGDAAQEQGWAPYIRSVRSTENWRIFHSPETGKEGWECEVVGCVSPHSHSQTSPLCLGPPSAPAPMLVTCLHGMAGAGSDFKDASGSSGLFCKGLHWFIETSTGCVCLRGGAGDGGEQLDGLRCPAPEPQLSPKTLGIPLLAERSLPCRPLLLVSSFQGSFVRQHFTEKEEQLLL